MDARRTTTSCRSASGLQIAARRMALLLLSGLSLVAVVPAVTLAQTASVARPSSGDPYAAHIAEAAARFGLPPAWIRAVMRAESAGDRHATSPKGAMGLMQIMPGTWAGLRLRYRLGADPYDPRDNIIAGAGYIRELFDRYGSPGWIAAYNAGPGRYEASLTGRPLPLETRSYIANVAPAIGTDECTNRIVVATADSLTWTRAPLFVAPSDRRPAADPLPAERSSDATENTALVRDGSAMPPPSRGLFVAPSGQRAVP